MFAKHIRAIDFLTMLGMKGTEYLARHMLSCRHYMKACPAFTKHLDVLHKWRRPGGLAAHS